MIEMTENRIIGLDVLRIFSMFGILGLHIIGNGGLLQNAKMTSFSYYIILMLYCIFYTSVDIFGILSGYLNVNKRNNKNNRIIELICILIFYCLIIPTVFYAFNIKNIRSIKDIKTIISNLFPILAGKYWYITCYSFLFFMIPYLNTFCKCIDKKTYKKLLLILFVLFTIIPNFLGMTDIFRILNGYSPFWLIFCYLLGGFIRIYNIDFDTKKIIKIVLILFIVEFVINIIVRNVGFLIFGFVARADWFINYISPFTVTISLLLLLLFKKISIRNQMIIKTLVYLSNMSFSVYIIHCHKIVFDYILKDLFIPILNYNFIIVSFVIALAIILIYMLCCLIDEFRKIIFKIFRIKVLIEKISYKLDRVLNF